MKNKRSENRFRAVMIQEQLSFLPDGWLENLKDMARDYKDFQYAYIIHDKDVNDEGKSVKAHVHIMARFGSSAVVKTLQEWSDKLGLPMSAIQKWRYWNNGLSYLLHETESSNNKYTYNDNDVIANFDYVSEMNRIRTKVAISKQMTADDAMDELAFCKLENIVDKRNVLKEKVKGSKRNQFVQQSRIFISNMLSDVPALQLKNVVWLWGATGVGKTKEALRLADAWGSYYLTGADRDTFQDYQFEKTWIVDDARPSMFSSVGEFLRILDSYSVTRIAPARYHNVNLGLVENIIITTPEHPEKWFRGFEDSLGEDYGQLDRRLTEITRVGHEKVVSI